MKYYVPHPRMFGLLWYVMHGEIIDAMLSNKSAADAMAKRMNGYI